MSGQKARAPRAIGRRDALKTLGVAGTGLAFAPHRIRGTADDITVAGQPVEIAIHSLSPVTVRISVLPIRNNDTIAVPETGALDPATPVSRVVRSRERRSLRAVRAGELVVKFIDSPPTLHVETRRGTLVQRLVLDSSAASMRFLLPEGPLLGLGEGGPQFDRKGSTDNMVSGQDGGRGYRLATHGARAPIQWLVGTDGWGMFIHQPYGAFDFTGTEGTFLPGTEGAPLDLFVVASNDPAVLMREYGRITGFAEMPAKWTFGYQQSHRTLAGPDEILGVARTFREKKLPCDALIYLGTEFTPSGWNTRNGEFTWHPKNFPDPKGMIDALHREHFKVTLHVVVEGHHLTGTVHDQCTAPPLPSGRTADNRWPPDRQVSCYWPAHRPLMDVGVDGWWPDQGDDYDPASELNRHRMYWEGTQMYRPNERPYALHRNASAGSQRYGGFLWSGDISTRWETLKTHVPIAINTGLSGLPYWGTDIGGFIPTAEYTGELHARWFQFGAFCPLFRAHGRNWHLRLPWGWDGGDGGPPESGRFQVDPAELHNPEVERICRKYLELRYRLMPYLYTAVRECHDTGMPIVRAMWLHYPADTDLASRGDQYLWGRDLLVAPVVEKGATSRRVRLPIGTWYDFWTDAPVLGGLEVERSVDLATMPLYVRAGSVVPMDPVRQYVNEPTAQPTTLVVYPGADGESTWYDDDGKSFDYRRGEFTRLLMHWNNGARRLTLRMGPGSRPPAPDRRRVDVRIAGESRVTSVEIGIRSTELKL